MLNHVYVCIYKIQAHSTSLVILLSQCGQCWAADICSHACIFLTTTRLFKIKLDVNKKFIKNPTISSISKNDPKHSVCRKCGTGVIFSWWWDVLPDCTDLELSGTRCPPKWLQGTLKGTVWDMLALKGSLWKNRKYWRSCLCPHQGTSQPSPRFPHHVVH